MARIGRQQMRAMTLLPVAPPQPVPMFSGFDYVVADAAHRRIYAAHPGSAALLIVDADTGKVLGQVKVGFVAGIAVDPATGHVFTGNGEARSVSEIDPVAMKELRSVDTDGNVDAIAFDPSNGHIYADEDDGTHVYVIDAKTMTSVGAVALPGHKPEYLTVNPKTHEVYQNIANLGEFVVIDPTSLKVTRTVVTPEIKGNHPLQYDPDYDHVIVGGQNGTLAVYTPDGKLVGKTAIQARVDQCTLDRTSHEIACAGSGAITLLRDEPAGAPTILSQAKVDPGVHTTAIDPQTKKIWFVWASPTGDFVQALEAK